MIRKSVVLDIDGVLLKGGSVIEGARQAVAKLASNKIPFIFVTNGGGMREEVKAADLSKKLEIQVLPSQVVVCHTPLKKMTAQFSSKRVLVVGRQECLDVAHSYGFSKAINTDMLQAENPTIYPLAAPNQSLVATTSANREPIDSVAAVMIFHDPVNWGLEMQVMNDVLVDKQSRQRIPLFITNNDLLYNTEHPLPRFTQGAFVAAFKHLVGVVHGEVNSDFDLKINYFGKPFPEQYTYAQEVLAQECVRLQLGSPSVYFGIGDNPKSDIRGANSAGGNWRSILVRTGIFQSEADNCSVDPADFVCDDVNAAVDLIVDYEG